MSPSASGKIHWTLIPAGQVILQRLALAGNGEHAAEPVLRPLGRDLQVGDERGRVDVQKDEFGSTGATIPLTTRVIAGASPTTARSGPGIFTVDPSFRPNTAAVCCDTRTGSTG